MWKIQRNNGLQTFPTRKQQFQQACKIYHYWSVNTSKSKETLTQRLIEKENLCILKLDTLYPKGFNMGLNK